MNNPRENADMSNEKGCIGLALSLWYLFKYTASKLNINHKDNYNDVGNLCNT